MMIISSSGDLPELDRFDRNYLFGVFTSTLTHLPLIK
jgi:hypothetical protein